MIKRFITLLSLCSLCLSPALAEERQTPKYKIQVSVTNSLPADKFSQNWPVHIYLSAPNSKIPLSATKTSLDKLPFNTTLTEYDKVLPIFTLEGHKELTLVVKISSSGDPHKPGPEDYRQISPNFTLDANNQASIKLDLKTPR